MYLNCQNLMCDFIFWSNFSFLHSTCHFDCCKLLCILELRFCSSKSIYISSFKIFFLFYKKNILFFFTQPLLQNTHINLYILNICFNKIFILLYFFNYFLHTHTHTHTHSLSLSLSLKDPTQPKITNNLPQSTDQPTPTINPPSHHQWINPTNGLATIINPPSTDQPN